MCVFIQLTEKVVAEKLFQSKNALYTDSIAQPFLASTLGEWLRTLQQLLCLDTHSNVMRILLVVNHWSNISNMNTL